MMPAFPGRHGIGKAVGTLAAIAASTGLLAGAASAAAIAVLTKAEPGLSSAGTPIWHCTYVVENREMTVIFSSSCPASIDVE